MKMYNRVLKINKKYRSFYLPVFFILLVIFLAEGRMYASTAGKINRGNRLYKKEKYSEAAELYREALEGSDNLKGRYNLGNANYKLGRADKAKKDYLDVLEKEAGDNLEKDTNYNLGNLNYREGNISEAVKRWKKSLIADPGDEDARHNLELGLKMLKQQQQQSQKEKDKKDEQKEDEKSRQKKEEEKRGEKEKKEEEARRILDMLDNMEEKARKEKKMSVPAINVEQDW